MFLTAITGDMTEPITWAGKEVTGPDIFRAFRTPDTVVAITIGIILMATPGVTAPELVEAAVIEKLSQEHSELDMVTVSGDTVTATMVLASA